MKQKLKCILLIDDDEPTNYVHQRVINRVDCTEKVVIAENGLIAIEYLANTQSSDYIRPALIFLDINMPGMNGWDFLEAYKKLDDELRAEVVIVMLSTSLNPDDRERALSIDEIQGFENKILSVEQLQGILENHFSDFV